MSRVIEIAQTFSKFPGPRYKIHGDYSGQMFREEFLEDELRTAISQGSVLTVVLDDVAGYGSSFLEEAFGGLVRNGFTKEDLDQHLEIVARTPRFRHHAMTARKYIDDEASRSQLLSH